MTRTPAALVAVLLVLPFGCGGAQRTEAPASVAPNVPHADDEAPAASAAPGGGIQLATPHAPLLPPAPPQPSPADQPTERRTEQIAARADLDRALRDLEAAASSCESACRALASMDRATSRLCYLADEPADQRRCDDARMRLTAARGRVRAACGACQ